MKEINITTKEENQRLDKFLLKYFNTAPKSFVYKMLRKKRIKYNNKKAEGAEMLKDGDTLQMFLAEETMEGFMEEKTLQKAERHFGIVYEDDNVLMVSKPAGLLSHPEKSSDTDTLVDQILYYLSQKGQYTPSKENSFTPAICNRLDRNTGGIVIAGKNLCAVQEINRVIAERKLKKYYITMVRGEMTEEKEFFGYHIKDATTNQVKVLKKETPGAKKIYTKVKPLAQKDKFSLLEIDLITGKSHQIRAHLKAMGYLVIGDRKYGEERVNRVFREKYGLNNQFLFAYRVVWQEDDGPLGYLCGKEFVAKLTDNLEAIKRDYFGKDLLQENKEAQR